MQEKKPRSNASRSADMRARLIAAGRKLFAEKGFAETGTPEIVRLAQVTRGALYHHFADKTDLFRAVVEAESAAVATEINVRAVPQSDPQAAIEDGIGAYFQAMSVPGRARLLLIEGPTVLGIDEMDRLDAGDSRAQLQAGLAGLCPAHGPDDLLRLAQILGAGFDRAALAVNAGADPGPYQQLLTGLILSLAGARNTP